MPPEEAIESPKPGVPERFSLDQNYPNPFNPLTVIRYQLPVQSRVTLKIYDVLGQEVATLVNEIQDAGFKSVKWNAGSMASGMYMYRIVAGTYSEVRKMMIIK